MFPLNFAHEKLQIIDSYKYVTICGWYKKMDSFCGEI